MATFHYEGKANSSGIYIIFNNQNWKVYIGSCKRFKQRWMEHVRHLRTQKHQNKHLQASFSKYGESAFEFFVVQDMPNSSLEERLKVEEDWIVIHFGKGRCYNGTKFAVSREGKPSKNPEETAKKLSNALKGRKISSEHREKISKANKGKILTENQIEKHRIFMQGKQFHLGHAHTELTKQKISNAKKGTICAEQQKLKTSTALIAFYKTDIGKGVAKLRGQTRIGVKRPPMTEEQKQKISASLKGNVPWNKDKNTGQIPWNKGLKNA